MYTERAGEKKTQVDRQRERGRARRESQADTGREETQVSRMQQVEAHRRQDTGRRRWPQRQKR